MSNDSSVVRIGLIACGRVTEERHLPALRGIPDARVVAAADLDAARLGRVADRFGIENRFTDYRAMLERDDLDAVAVLTPTPSHAEIGLAVLDAGKHLFMEKPLALTLAECDRLMERASRSSRQVMVGFNLRWHRLARRAQALIESGALGRIKAIRSAYTHSRTGADAPDWHRRHALGGGIIFNEGVHHFDLWRYLLGGEVVQVFCTKESSAHYEDETSVVSARMADGAQVSGVFSFNTGSNNDVEIYGEAGRLSLSCYKLDGLEFFPTAAYPGDLGHRLRKIRDTLVEAPRLAPVLRGGGDFAVTFRAEWMHFITCVREARTPECTLHDGRRALEIALAALESSSTHRPVLINGS